MKAPSHRTFIPLFAVLVVLMITTRFHHFGTALNLPDASMAVFFLGGLYLRRRLAFVAFVAFVVLAGVIDWIAIAGAGVSDFCVTPAYSFLLPAYAVLWYGGRLYADRLQPTWGSALAAFGVALVSASLSFAISNGAFYWLGGRYAEPNFTEYVARAWQWGPLFVRTTMAYVAAAAVVHGLTLWALRSRHAGARA